MLKNLDEFFSECPKAALAFSGGVDSSFLFYAGKKYGADIRAYYVKSSFQPQFELDDAYKIAEYLHAEIKVIPVDILSDPDIAGNPKERCYYCKSRIFSAILSEAKKDGYEVVIDGTNATDDAHDRPGMKALSEMKVRSPLRECGYTKQEIRKLSEEAGLFTWNKPAYACLATRIAQGLAITREKLERTENAERFLTGLGFSDFRVRMDGETAKLQVRKENLVLVLEKREEIFEELRKNYKSVVLDLEPR